MAFLASEKGRKGCESSSSSSASERGLRGAFDVEYRGRRAKTRLRFIGCGASESEDEEAEESLATADGLAMRSRERWVCLGDGSTGRCGGSRLRFRWAKTECLSTGDRGEPDREAFCAWVMVLVEVVRDIGAFTEIQRV